MLGYNILIYESRVNRLGLKRGEIMILSTKGRYGLKAMFQLALHYGEGPIPLNQIAEKQGLSENYLEQLFSTLKKEGLLNSVRGAQGGYMLSKSPEKITVGSVIRALEGNMAPAECVIDEKSDCSRDDCCATRLVWIKIKDSIDDVIDSITLQDMVDDEKKLLRKE